VDSFPESANLNEWITAESIIHILIRKLDSWRERRPGESHPEALAEPYVTLSRHTAPIKEPPRIMVQCANRCGERRETARLTTRPRDECNKAPVGNDRGFFACSQA